MLNIAICDDNKVMLPILADKILGEFNRRDAEVHCDLFDQASLLFDAAEQRPYDIVFSDIEMPGIDGFLLSEKLKSICVDTIIVFISSYDNLAIDSYAHDPLWFITKNSIDRLLPLAVAKCLDKKCTGSRVWEFKTGSGVIHIKVSQIKYLKCTNRTLTIQAVGQTLTTYGNLSGIESDFEAFDFVRVHRNYLVNSHFIQKVDRDKVVLLDDTVIPISQSKVNLVREAIINVS